ncbi:MAG TPA: trypsin-like peptidase domain-containing protein [Jatrophihabitans sp.]|nr:trypsin-like peptidase domain-containing protein [Jatrophihabitans sp.]
MAANQHPHDGADQTPDQARPDEPGSPGPEQAGASGQPQPTDQPGQHESGQYQPVRPTDPGYQNQGNYQQTRPYEPATASWPAAAGQYGGWQAGGQQGYQHATGHGGYGQWAGQPGAGYAPGYPGPAPYGDDATAAPPARGARRPLLVAVLVAALLGGGVGGGIVALADHSGGRSVDTGLRITNATGAPSAKLDGTVGAAAAKIRPSVVTINVTGQQEAGTGSGVIIRDDGYILTNDHVVDIANGAGDMQVVLSDGRTAAAKIVGRDTSDDLAVIKVDGLSGLTAATFARSSSLSVGQTVVAVGAPLGLSDTVTSGIVSTLARPVRAGDNDQAVFNAVQTDAAINPGNSGGPLVDLNGSVVGINAAIASDNSGGGGLQIPGQQSQAGNIGIGFAIPSDEASRIASELIASGKATHAVLGVQVTNAQNGPTGTTTGVPLSTVSAGGVAAKAGLQRGDLVTKVDDQQVTTADALIAAVRSHAPGEKVTITYVRGGKTSSVSVTLGSSDS